MRRLLSVKTILMLSALLLGGLAAATTQWRPGWAMVAAFAQDKEKSRGLENERERREEHEREFMKDHTDASGRVRPDLWRKGILDYRRMKIAAGVRLSRGEALGGVAGVQWKQVGPAPLLIDKEQNFQGEGPDSGEVVDIAIDPRNTTDRTIYIATNDGGIWKSTDGGASWAPKTDFMPSLSMGAVALDPGNPSIVYAGTGNPFDGGGVFSKGVGLYKSIDSGETWTGAGASVLNNRSIVRIALPTPGVLLVATTTGLFRSIDGGMNFGNNMPNFNNGSPVLGGFITDLHLDTASPTTTVLAAVNGTGILRSTDGGATFPATSNLFTATNGAPTANFSFISFSQSTQPDNQTIYASVKDSRAQTMPPRPSPFPFLGLFKSTNGGGTWTRMAGADSSGNGCQCGYDQTIGVDPQDASRVYIGFQELHMSSDGGGSFSNVSANKIHFDHHAIVFSPPAHISGGPPTRVWVGTDGGVHSSTNAGGAWANLNDGIGTNLFFSLDIGRGSATNNMYTYGGTQDTGTIEHQPGFPGAEWHLGIDGDGGRIAVDPCNPMHAIGADNGGFQSTSDGGNNWSGGGGFPASTSVGVLAFDPNCGKAYAGAVTTQPMMMPSILRLFQSTDNAATFSPIRTFTAGITAIGTSKLDSNTLWVALGDGTLQRTANVQMGAAATWTTVTVTGALAGRRISAIAIDPGNTSMAVVVYAGFTNINPSNRTKHVFLTTDNGATWADISGVDGGDPTQNLPDLPLHDVVVDPGTNPHTIIVASDAGVLRSANLGATWEVLGLGLPTVLCNALALDSSASPSLLRVGTYGRSSFELSAASGPLLGVNADLAFGSTCDGQNTVRKVELFNVGSSDLHISSFIRLSGNADFQLISGPSTPVTIRPGEHLDFTIRFKPTGVGDETAIFQINSDDPFEPSKQLMVSGAGVTRRIATLIADSGNFGDVCLGSFKDLGLTISNSGFCDLTVTSITIAPATDFLVPSALSFPLVIHAGDSIEAPIRFQPASKGNKSATVRIFSNDPTTPDKTVAISGNALAPSITVNDPIVFDKTCPGNTNNKTLTISNTGFCDLVVKSITSSNPLEFKVAPSVAFPLIVPPGSSRDIAIQFMPIGFTIDPMRMATLTIMSNDPDMGMKDVKVIGTVPPPVIQVAPDPLDFGEVCLNTSKVLPLVISNSGECNLTVSGITFSSTEFKLISPPAFPFVILPGGSRTVMVSFMPVGATGPRMETMTINSDDPVTPLKVVTLKGVAPVSAIAVSGSMDFGDVKVGGVRDQVLNITNTAPCDLLITLICEVQNGPVKFPSTEFNVISPAVTPKLIPGGGTLPVIIRFKPMAKGPRTATLLVFGFDPATSSILLTQSFPLKGVGK